MLLVRGLRVWDFCMVFSRYGAGSGGLAGAGKAHGFGFFSACQGRDSSF